MRLESFFVLSTTVLAKVSLRNDSGELFRRNDI
jgi:hypothetical protein